MGLQKNGQKRRTLSENVSIYGIHRDIIPDFRKVEIIEKTRASMINQEGYTDIASFHNLEQKMNEFNAVFLEVAEGYTKLTKFDYGSICIHM